MVPEGCETETFFARGIEKVVVGCFLLNQEKQYEVSEESVEHTWKFQEKN